MISSLGLESEIANDFVWGCQHVEVGKVVWWGGYFNVSTPCESGITTPGFNLRFYSDAGCVPGDLYAELAVTDFTETAVGCQGGTYPLFKWSADIYVTPPGDLNWFSPQMMDHAFPPQGGRLASAVVTGCNAMFRSAYFGYPDWTRTSDVFGAEVDFSQEFWGTPERAACCVGEECRFVDLEECQAVGGAWQGYGSTCEPNPCLPTAVKATTWGRVKAGYR